MASLGLNDHITPFCVTAHSVTSAPLIQSISIYYHIHHMLMDPQMNFDQIQIPSVEAIIRQ